VRATIVEDNERLTLVIPFFPTWSRVLKQCLTAPVGEDIDVDKQVLLYVILNFLIGQASRRQFAVDGFSWDHEAWPHVTAIRILTYNQRDEFPNSGHRVIDSVVDNIGQDIAGDRRFIHSVFVSHLIHLEQKVKWYPGNLGTQRAEVAPDVFLGDSEALFVHRDSCDRADFYVPVEQVV
jgi:hypothetical protein